MQFWFARDADVPLREQLVTQVILGILCDELRAGQRLPSTRELARRFHIHPNTISSAYRQLQRERWLEFRHGSGVYVRSAKPETVLSSELALDRLIRQFFHSAKALNITLPAIRNRLKHWLQAKPPDRFVLIEPDPELRRILLWEIQAIVALPVLGCGLETGGVERMKCAIAVTLSRHVEAVRERIPAGLELISLRLNSVPASLVEWLPAPKNALVGIVSRWPKFLKSAKTMLVAAGFHQDALFFRDARKRDWRSGIDQAAAVVCDSVTAAQLPKGIRAISFHLLSVESREELQKHQEFTSHPLIRAL